MPLDTALIDGELVALAADGTTSFAGLQDAIATRRHRRARLFRLRSAVSRRLGPDRRGAGGPQGGARRDRAAQQRRHAALQRPPDRSRRRISSARPASTSSKASSRSARDRALSAGPRQPTGSRSNAAIARSSSSSASPIPSGSRQGFGALLLGYYDPQGKLRYAGPRRHRLQRRGQLVELQPQLDALERPDAAGHLAERGLAQGRALDRAAPRRRGAEFATGRRTAIAAPSLVPGVARGQGRRGGRVRPDKPRAGCPRPPGRDAAEGESHGASAQIGKRPNGAGTAEKPACARATAASTFDGRAADPPRPRALSRHGITKLEWREYYAAVRDWALPQLARPAADPGALPRRLGKECFYQKHVGARRAGRRRPRSRSPRTSRHRRSIPTSRISPGSIALVQMGVLEIHPWGSTVEKLETPDRVTFDLDPDEGLPWQRVTEAAIEMREALARDRPARALPRRPAARGCTSSCR